MKTNDECRAVQAKEGKDDERSPRCPFDRWASSPSPSVCTDEDDFPDVVDFFQFDLSAREVRLDMIARQSRFPHVLHFCSGLNLFASPARYPHPLRSDGALLCVVNLRSQGVEYFPGTDCPVDGWFQPCKSCNEMTANIIAPEPGSEVSVCRRCVAKDMYRLEVSECSTSAPQQAEMLSPPSSPEPEQCSNDLTDDPITRLLFSKWDTESEIDWTCWLGLADDSSTRRRRNTVCHRASSPVGTCMSPSMTLKASMAITA